MEIITKQWSATCPENRHFAPYDRHMTRSHMTKAKQISWWCISLVNRVVSFGNMVIITLFMCSTVHNKVVVWLTHYSHTLFVIVSTHHKYITFIIVTTNHKLTCVTSRIFFTLPCANHLESRMFYTHHMLVTAISCMLIVNQIKSSSVITTCNCW